MKPTDLESMSVDELWSLRALLIAVLTGKMSAEKTKIDRQLRQLGLGAAPNNSKNPHARRPYPQVFPKYSNPRQAVRNLGGSRETATLADCTAQGREKARRFPDQTLPGRARRSTR